MPRPDLRPARRLLPFLLVAFTLLTACAPAAPSTGPAPAWSADSPAGEIARWMRRACRGPLANRQCTEQNLVALVGQAGIGRAMEVLDTLMRVDAGVRTYGHELAHGMGIAAYTGPQTMHAAFAACPAGEGAGCHHGVVQGYFLDLVSQGRMPGTAELDALCEPHRPNTFLYGQCGHGMGHGLMAVYQNHVPRTLRACDQASDPYIRESCYSGIFMENIVLVTHPHNTTGGHGATQGRHGADDAHAGHGDAHGGHGASADHGSVDHGTADEPWQPLDRDDPLYPCSVVGEQYQPACYVMQTGAMLYLNGGSVTDAGHACEGAPQRMMPICFGSLGRDIMALAEMDHARSLAMCGRVARMGGGQGELWCMLGVVQNLVNLAATADEGMRFCRLVTADGHKSECYRAVGEQMLTLLPADEQRGHACQSAEPGFVAACRMGARLADAAREDQVR
ncbi:hypothetical protein [Longimicrobium sp.]|uniref:hypothetical protein n=1 Tax=Longimicrobium sp. TaxID=2029185 RepID=UPI002E2EDA7D|nr:hypothetical protein [Longimicrobium sp.]HEX6038983.1 hypothetical protein [Longimicrobium sp.]